LITTLFLAVAALASLSSMPARESGGPASGDPAATAGIQRYADPAELTALIEIGSPEHILIDVRTPAEYGGGFIPTAVNIPVDNIAADPPDVPKDRLVVVYCRSGNRSSRAAGILRDLGYTRVVDFGGIMRWQGGLQTPES
jgi:rhodanese-related sulfurtransferase